MGTKAKRKNKHIPLKVFSGIFIVLLLIIVSFFWGGNSGLPAINSKTNILDKIMNSSSSGGKLELTSDEVNCALELIGAKDKKKGDITLRGLYVKINNGKITVFAPVKYKGIGLLLSSRNDIVYNGNTININPENFKAGLIPLPKNLVMNELKKFNIANVTINDNLISIEKKALPIKIDSFAINNNKLVVDLPKIDIVSSINEIIDNESKNYINQEESSNPSKTTNDTTGKKSNQNAASNKPSSSKRSYNKKVNKAQRSVILKKALSQLNASISAVNSSKSKAVIEYAKSALGKLITDPSYNYQGDLIKAKSIYDSLSLDEQERVKAAIFSNVDAKSIMKALAIKQ